MKNVSECVKNLRCTPHLTMNVLTAGVSNSIKNAFTILGWPVELCSIKITVD